ncbi:hypothetical protein H8356DRAFT_1268098 [Neocallimastix lanati (nom. inval.)]|nr:hypothetical protein H8356DRAFT_1268098 [Neocallimastix sp. JGI-2020a]
MGFVILNKNSPETNTCNHKDYNSFFQGINSQFRDSFFFSFIIQFILVCRMYFNVGNRKYWNVLFYSSLAGLIGSVIENSTIAFICRKSQEGNMTKVYTFFIQEIFWIINEYSVPYLNLIRMKSISEGKIVQIIQWVIYILFFPFTVARVHIGYCRLMEGVLNSKASERSHGIAFGIMGIADVVCTLTLLYLLRNENNDENNNNVHSSSIILKVSSVIVQYIKHSNYIVLIFVDIVSFILSFLYIFSTCIVSDPNFESSPMPFHCLKCVFILILAVDAMVYKYDICDEIEMNQQQSTFSSDFKTQRDCQSNPNVQKSNEIIQNPLDNTCSDMN